MYNGLYYPSNKDSDKQLGNRKLNIWARYGLFSSQIFNKIYKEFVIYFKLHLFEAIISSNSLIRTI